MKKYLPLIILFVSSTVSAQVPEDALRFSFYPQNGTARNLAIGGAMGSLGGDINATFVNPAGLGFYKTGELAITPGFMSSNNSTNYRETATKNSNNNFGFGTIGLVEGFSNRNKPHTSTAISFAVTQTANFNSKLRYSGLNNYSSFSEQFAEEFAKSGLSINDVLSGSSPYPYTSAPALYTYLIDTVKVNGVYQVKAAPEYILDAGKAVMQEMNKVTKGGITELAIGFALNQDDKWFLGGTIGVPLVHYTSNTEFRESDTSGNTNNHFKSFVYTDNFTTDGVGVNLKLGVIYRPKDFIRIGLAVHTPTYMSLTDKRHTTISTELENPVGAFNVSSNIFTNGMPGEVNYGQITPFKAILSGSYVFREASDTRKQRAFITADVEYVHHQGSSFKSEEKAPADADKAYYTSLNKVVATNYKGNFNFRAGAELKFNIIMARLGFAYYGSPYQDVSFKVNKMLLSGGLGYRNKGMFVDLTYVHSISNDVNFPYRLEDRANTFASYKQQMGNVVATVGFKF